MKWLRYILEVARENPLYVWMFGFVLLAFVLLVGALLSTL